MTASNSRFDPSAGLDGAARRRVRLAGLIGALLAMLALMAVGDRLRRPLSDLFQNLSPAPAVSKRVHVVVIDADSLDAIGGWPWSRYYLARLVEEIADRQPAAIGLDLLMPEPDRVDPRRFADLYGELTPATAAEVRALPSMDAVFSRVIGRSPVVLARAGLQAQSFDTLEKAADPAPPEAIFSSPLPVGLNRYPHAVANLPILDGAALGHGLVNGDPDSDGVVRRVPLVARVAGQPTPGFALELARVAANQDRIDLKTIGSRLVAVRAAGHAVPAGADGTLALRFGDWRRTQTTSAANLLRKGLPDDLFKGQIVLVGLTSAGSSDVVTTPLASETYGVFVQAQAVDAILRGEGLRTPIWATAVVWNLGVLLTLAAVGLVWRLPAWGMAAGAVGAVLATAVLSWAAFRSGLLLDPFPTAVPMVVTVAAMLAGLFAEGRRLQARLRLALQEERVAAAKVAGELAAAADIQAGMLLPRADLERLRKDVELDAVLQPARNVGGDLYDAFTLPDGRLCFLVGDVTGKGVPAALFMALSKSLARNLLTRPGLDLTAAVAEINAELSTDNREAMALSLLVGVLEDADGRLSLCCAGHENPLIAGADGTVRDVTLIGGPPLCVAASFPYTVEPCRLGPGETLLVFSDGLTEAQAPDGTLLSRDQLFALVGKASRAPTAAAMVDAVVAGVRAFEAGSEPSDDLTVLALRLPSG